MGSAWRNDSRTESKSRREVLQLSSCLTGLAHYPIPTHGCSGMVARLTELHDLDYGQSRLWVCHGAEEALVEVFAPRWPGA